MLSDNTGSSCWVVYIPWSVTLLNSRQNPKSIYVPCTSHLRRRQTSPLSLLCPPSQRQGWTNIPRQWHQMIYGLFRVRVGIDFSVLPSLIPSVFSSRFPPPRVFFSEFVSSFDSLFILSSHRSCLHLPVFTRCQCFPSSPCRSLFVSGRWVAAVATTFGGWLIFWHRREKNGNQKGKYFFLLLKERLQRGVEM